MRETTFTHTEVIAAIMCFDVINDWTIDDINRKYEPWVKLRENVGTAELRDYSITLGQWCEEIYDILTKHDRDFLDGVAWDFEIVPMMLQHITPGVHDVNIPNAQHTASLVAHEHALNEYKQQCRWRSKDRWHYEGFADDCEEHIIKGFEAGDDPHELIDRLAHKYDLHDFS